jgi:hypothetical protein
MQATADSCTWADAGESLALFAQIFASSTHGYHDSLGYGERRHDALRLLVTIFPLRSGTGPFI